MSVASSPTAPASLPAEGIHRILICHVSHTLGNALLLTPLLQELEATWPGAEIDIVTRSQIAEAIYGGYFNVATLFKLPSHGVGHFPRWFRGWFGSARKRYDLVIDPDPRSRTNGLFLRHAQGRFKLGFQHPKKKGLTHAIPLDGSPDSKGKRPVYLLRRALGKPADATPYPTPDIRLSEAERTQGREALARVLATRGLDLAKGAVGIFANATGPKLLRSDWWTPFLDTLEPLVGDRHLVEIVPASGQAMLGTRYPTYFSGDLRKLASVLSALSMYTSADCGVMHLSCAARGHTFGIFNTTNAEQWGPYGAGNHTVHAYDMTPADVARKLASMARADSVLG